MIFSFAVIGNELLGNHGPGIRLGEFEKKSQPNYANRMQVLNCGNWDVMGVSLD